MLNHSEGPISYRINLFPNGEQHFRRKGIVFPFPDGYWSHHDLAFADSQLPQLKVQPSAFIQLKKD